MKKLLNNLIQARLSNNRWLLFLILFFLSIGCKNQYENKIIGIYVIDKKQSNENNYKILSPSLELRNDKTFVLNFLNKGITGMWSAGDNGDFTWANLVFENKEAQCKISGLEYEFIEILIPNLLSDSLQSKLIFVRDKKTFNVK